MCDASFSKRHIFILVRYRLGSSLRISWELQRVLNAYVMYFNQARPHQGIQQQIPDSCGSSRSAPHETTKVVALPILAGLHHDYRKVA